ncbi:MAG: MFS transporter [Thermoplasmata archaeon]|nr:MFS transporter [Thermoplasmata archaeon]
MSASTPGSPLFLRLVRNRNFSLLWLGAVVSASGFYVGNVVIEWLIYHSSGNALYLASLGVVEFVPTLTIGVVAGAWVDRFDRRRLMIVSDLARAATWGALAVAVLTLGFNLPVLLLAVLIAGAFGTIFGPSSNALLPSLLGKDNLASGNGVLEAGRTVAGFVGSPIGGALILIVGIAGGLIFNALTFAFSALMIGLMIVPTAVARSGEPATPAAPSILSDVRAGLRFLLTQRALLAFTLGAMALNFFTYYLIFIVVYVTNLLHAGPAVFGLLVGVQSAGYAVGALLIVGRLGIDRSPGLWISVLWALSGPPLIVMVLFPVIPVAIASLAALGFLTAVSNITFLSAVQKVVPGEFLGRYFAMDQAGSYAMVPAGLAVGGLLVVAFGVGFAFALAGGATLVVGLLFLLRSDVRSWGRT